MCPLSDDGLAEYDNNLKVTRVIDAIRGDHIYSYVKPENWSVFSYLRSFDVNVWLAIICSLVLIVLVVTFITLTEKSFQMLQNVIWNYV